MKSVTSFKKNHILSSLLICLAMVACGSDDSVSATMSAQSANSGNRDTVVFATDSPMLNRIAVNAVESRQVPLSAISVPARLEIDPLRQAKVRLPVSGRVTAVDVIPGQIVSAGQVLLQVDSAEAQEAMSMFAQTTAGLRRATFDLERVQNLYEIDAIARRDLVEAEMEMAHAQAELAVAQRQLRVLGLDERSSSSLLMLRSPINGRVMELNVSPGEFVADDEEPLVQVADLGNLLAVAFVPEHRLAALITSTAATVHIPAFPTETFDGEIVRISDAIDPETRTLKVFVSIDNSEGLLRPEMFGSVTLSSAATSLPVVADTAVFYQGSDAFVFVETTPASFTMRRVTTGTRVAGSVAVNDGLNAGDRVVTDGVMLLVGQGRSQ